MSSRILVGSFVIGAIYTNFYYLHREDSKECIVFDPADLGDQIYEELTGKQGLSIQAILLTHAHFDHIGGVAALKERCRANVYASELEKRLCASSELNHSALHGRPCTVKPDVWLRDGEELTLAGITLRVLSTPGHTEGSCCYYIEDAGEGAHPILISGDTLFAQSYGRTDLPTGSESAIQRSIRDKLLVLPDDTDVYPGHEQTTTIAFEKKYNPLAY